MNTELPTMVLRPGLLMAELQSYGQSALALMERLLSAIQMWARALGGSQGPVLIATASVGAAVLLTLVCVNFLLIRARRETRKLREEHAKLIALTEAAESANEKKAEFIAS